MNTSLRDPRPPGIITSGPTPSFTDGPGPAQLAAILAETLRENENLKRELAIARRSVEKHEHMTGLTQNSPQNSTSPPSPKAPSQSAMNRLIDCQNELERVKIERDEAQARVKILQELWNQLHRSYLDHCDFGNKDACKGFNKRIADAESELVEITPEQAPFPNAGPFPPPTALVLSRPIPSPVICFSVPRPGTRVRPRAGSLDGPSHSTGGLPPAKRLRVDEISLAESGKCDGSVRFQFIFECFPFLDHSKAQNRSCPSAPTSVKASSNQCISRATEFDKHR